MTDYHLKLLTQQIISDPNYKVTLPFKTEGDPHHFEPKTSAVKSFIMGDLKIINKTGDSWREGLIKKTKSHASLVLKPDDAYADAFTTLTFHGLSHFWLNPMVGCLYFSQIKDFLVKLKISIKANTSCPYKIMSEVAHLAQSAPWHAIILTHDASEAFFQHLSPKILLTLKGSHHGDRIKATELKKVYTLTAKDQKKPILWLLESQLDVPARLERRIRSFDHVLKLDTLGKNLKSSEEILNTMQVQMLQLLKQAN